MKTLIKRFLKWLEPHEWEYFDLVVNPEIHDYHVPYYKYRYSHNHKVHQRQDTHCLGLNPPRYIADWVKCDKPHYRYPYK